MCTIFEISNEERGPIEDFFDDAQNQKLIAKYHPKYGDIFEVMDMDTELSFYDGNKLIDLGGDLDATGGFVSPFFQVLNHPYYFKIDHWYSSFGNFWLNHKPYLNELLSSIHEITESSLKSKFVINTQTYTIIFDITHDHFWEVKEDINQAFFNHLQSVRLLNLEFVKKNLLCVINCTYYD